jgi:hypothetical protein
MKEKLEGLDYADDTCLLAQRFCNMQEELKRPKEEAELVGLHINLVGGGGYIKTQLSLYPIY